MLVISDPKFFRISVFRPFRYIKLVEAGERILPARA
jgi:hypothetical protein